MTIREIAHILQADFLFNPADLDVNIYSACSADMMSAVLYYHTPNSLLITGLTHHHVIRTSEIAGIRTIVFVLNKRPEQSTIELGIKKNIPLMSTPFCMYTASGRLYQAGMPGCLLK